MSYYVTCDINNYVTNYSDKRRYADDHVITDKRSIALLNSFDLMHDGKSNFCFYNNKIVLSDYFDESVYSLNTYKQNIIKLLDENAYDYIVNSLRYPLWRQNQINNYRQYTDWTEDDYYVMHNAINNIKHLHNTKKQQIVLATSILMIDAVDITF